jgi:hypothetical protein
MDSSDHEALQALSLLDPSINYCWFRDNNVHIYQLDLSLPPQQHQFKYSSTVTNLFVTESLKLNTFKISTSNGRGFTAKIITPQSKLEYKSDTVYMHHPSEDIIWAYHFPNALTLWKRLSQNIIPALSTMTHSNTDRTLAESIDDLLGGNCEKVHQTPQKGPKNIIAQSSQQKGHKNRKDIGNSRDNAQLDWAHVAGSGIDEALGKHAEMSMLTQQQPQRQPIQQHSGLYAEVVSIQQRIELISQQLVADAGHDGTIMATMIAALQAQMQAIMYLVSRQPQLPAPTPIPSQQPQVELPSPSPMVQMSHQHQHHLQQHPPIPYPAVAVSGAPQQPIQQLPVDVDAIKDGLATELVTKIEEIFESGPPPNFLNTIFVFFQTIIEQSHFSPPQSTQPIHDLLNLLKDQSYVALLTNNPLSVGVGGATATSADPSSQQQPKPLPTNQDEARYTFLNTILDAITMLHPSLAQSSIHFDLFCQNYQNVRSFLLTYSNEPSLGQSQTATTTSTTPPIGNDITTTTTTTTTIITNHTAPDSNGTDQPPQADPAAAATTMGVGFDNLDFDINQLAIEDGLSVINGQHTAAQSNDVVVPLNIADIFG